MKMGDMFKVLSGVMIPFLGTALGAGMVFFMKEAMSARLQKLLLVGIQMVLICQFVKVVFHISLRFSNQRTA